MTINITVECDANNCYQETEIDDNHDSCIESAGWHLHPDGGYMHYCPECWPKVKKEIEEEEVDGTNE